MAKIRFGNQKGDSKFTLDVVTHSSSATEIEVGDQKGRSVRDAHVTDLPSDIDFASLALDLARIRTTYAQQLQGAAAEDLKEAETAARAGDHATAIKLLKQSGSWLLDLAKTIGADVAVAAIKASLGLTA